MNLRLFVCLSCAILCACTDPIGRTNSGPLRVSIDADTKVRRDTVRVELVIEAQGRDGDSRRSTTWEVLAPQTFRPTQDSDWPWTFVLPPEKSDFSRYELTATARDARDAVVGRVQAVRELAQIRKSGLRVRFEDDCFRPPELCQDGSSCSAGKCIDSALEPGIVAAEGGKPAPDGGREPAGDSTTGVAADGETCKADERACVGEGTRTPLACENGTWRAQPECLESERCNTADGPTRGMCQPIADQCINRQANVPYCDGEQMRICVDLVESVVRACSENERCVADAMGARCACRPGFVPEQSRCVQAKECGTARGGCDPLTQCRMIDNMPKCGDCPAGYSGTGDQGCTPLLLGLQLSAGTLEPAFAADQHDYRVRVPLLAPRVEITPTIPAKSTVSLNGAGFDSKTLTPVLPLGKPMALELVVTSEFAVTNKYTITFERTGEQQSYVKSVNAGSYDQFGSSVDIEADTMVVGAWFEDQGGMDTGSAYVLTRDGDSWKVQERLEPNDPADYNYFGSSVSLEGETIAVGAIRQGLFTNTTPTPRQGAVYIYQRTPEGWKQTQRLAAPKQDEADLFGNHVVLSGDTLLVGAPTESSGAKNSGAVYFYRRDGAMFSQVQKLKSNSVLADAHFGSDAEFDGDTLVVGAPALPSPNWKGSAEVFVRNGGEWSYLQTLAPGTLSTSGSFGYQLAVHGDRIAISAPHPSDYPGSPTPTDPGEVYIFERQGGMWQETAKLRAPSPRRTDWFGLSLLLLDNTLVIGAPGDASGARGIPADPARSDAAFSGAVYIYAASDQGWTQSGFFKGSNTDVDDWFGIWLATDGQSLLVSALFENGTSARAAGGGLTTGAVYLFH